MVDRYVLSALILLHSQELGVETDRILLISFRFGALNMVGRWWATGTRFVNIERLQKPHRHAATTATSTSSYDN